MLRGYFLAAKLGGRCSEIGRVKYSATKTRKGSKCKNNSVSAGYGPKQVGIGAPSTRKVPASDAGLGWECFGYLPAESFLSANSRPKHVFRPPVSRRRIICGIFSSTWHASYFELRFKKIIFKKKLSSTWHASYLEGREWSENPGMARPLDPSRRQPPATIRPRSL